MARTKHKIKKYSQLLLVKHNLKIVFFILYAFCMFWFLMRFRSNEMFHHIIFQSQHVNHNQDVHEEDILTNESRIEKKLVEIKNDETQLQSVILAKKLQSMVSGKVFSILDDGYEFSRTVHNGGCRARPLIVLIPYTTEDVSAGVVFARRRGLEVSVRSGGHSYTCTSIREGGLHFDMRKMNKVEMVKKKNELAVSLGPGSTWGRVLKIVSPYQFTLIHGQCTSVGVGGYLLGGGVNFGGTSNKYGFGAEHVLAYTMVTASGDIATVEEEKTTITRVQQSSSSSYGLAEEEIKHNEDNDLMFALRGAGSSFGIITEFLYKIYPVPETLPVYLLIWVGSLKDLLNLQEAAFNPNCPYNIAINHGYYFTGDMFSYPAGIANFFYKLLMYFNRGTGKPLLLQVTDISKNALPQTDIQSTIEYLKRYSVEILFQNTFVVTFFSRMFFKMHGSLFDYEHIYMEKDKAKNHQKIASANIAGIENITEIAPSFLQNPKLGVNLKHKNLVGTEFGCDFCFWVIVFTGTSQLQQKNGRRNKIMSINPGMYKKQTLATELTCMFKDFQANKGCPDMLKRIRNKFFKSQRKLNKSVVQYGNTPTCDGEHFGGKYWGSNYPKLIKIKKFWDPGNVFNHCQSVGSNNMDCCPK